MEKYELKNKIGSGTFGNVFEATNNITGKKVAIKCMKQRYYSIDECIQLREVHILYPIIHPNIIKLYEVFLYKFHAYLVFDYMKENLYQFIKKQRKPLEEWKVKIILYQILCGIHYLHSKDIIHRDIKPENILIQQMKVKIGDLGSARTISSRPPYSDYVSTRWYRAPELLLRSPFYSKPSDIWSIGCLLVELCSFNPIFMGNNDMDQLYKICSILGSPKQSQWNDGCKLAKQLNFVFPNFKKLETKILPEYSNDMNDIVMKMLIWNPNCRWSSLQLLKHPLFDDIRKVVNL